MSPEKSLVKVMLKALVNFVSSLESAGELAGAVENRLRIRRLEQHLHGFMAGC